MIFSNLRDGWNKEHVGSHTVRDNEIYNCGQAGIIGCMGGAFSRIVHNHIHHINVRQEISGAEIAGIKLHAAIDVMIERNFIHGLYPGALAGLAGAGSGCPQKRLLRQPDGGSLR